MKVFLVAGEASGDALGARLMAGLKALHPEVRFVGVGGRAMAAEGLESLFPSSELSVMGLAEILPRYAHLRRRLLQVVEAVLETVPDVLIGIDSPDFCLRVDARVRAAAPGIRIVHYVAPSVWAWRPGRAAKMARHVDQVLALLPFEPPYMEAAGMRCDFVGHPVVSTPRAGAAEIADLRTELGLGEAPFVVALPGSRRSEISRLAPVFGVALRDLLRRRPDLRVVCPAAAGLEEELRGLTADWPATSLLEGAGAMRKAAAFGGAAAALAASGTVSLELAAAGTPMVVAYDVNRLTWAIARAVVRVDTVTLVNLIEGRKVVPEFLGPACRPEPIAAAMDGVLEAPGAQAEALERTMVALGRDGPPPGERAARAVLEGLGA